MNERNKKLHVFTTDIMNTQSLNENFSLCLSESFLSFSTINPTKKHEEERSLPHIKTDKNNENK